MSKQDHGARIASRHGHARSPQWHRVQHEHLARFPRCVCCAPGQADGEPVQVHHIFPFHYCIAFGRPELELDHRNLITLCESERGHHAPNHHLLIGHADSFEASNLNLVMDTVGYFHGLNETQVKQSPHYREMLASRVKPLHEMTDYDKQSFMQALNSCFPYR